MKKNKIQMTKDEAISKVDEKFYELKKNKN